jgi:hypothetical protein
MMAALGAIVAVMVIALSVALNALSEYMSGSTDRFPLAQVVIGFLLVVIGFVVGGFVIYDRRGVVTSRNNESAATVGKIRAEAEAVTYSAKAEYARLKMQASAVANAGAVRELPPASIDETRLLSRPYTMGKRMVAIPLHRMKRLIEIYPDTSRSAIKAAGITSGDQDCADLVGAAELEGWVAREGQGKPATWVISPIQARRAYMLLVEDAISRTRSKAPSFEAPSPQNALLIQPQHVYETGRQTGRQALEAFVEGLKPKK